MAGFFKQLDRHRRRLPKEISDLTLKTVCDFYGGDWLGAMDIDMDTCLWRPVCWLRSEGANDTTLERLSGLEDAEVMPRWLESMKSASRIVLTDTRDNDTSVIRGPVTMKAGRLDPYEAASQTAA